MVEAVRAILADPALAEIGVVIFVNQLDQIGRLVDEMGLLPHQFAIRTGKDNEALNAQGCQDHREAQVLITTQQKLLRIISFQKDFESFWQFRGKPRRVRIWDEAILPAEPIVITMDEIVGFGGQLTSHGEAAAAEIIREWTETIGDDQVTTVPSFIPHLTFKNLRSPPFRRSWHRNQALSPVRSRCPSAQRH